jgi:hypothetical protein
MLFIVFIISPQRRGDAEDSKIILSTVISTEGRDLPRFRGFLPSVEMTMRLL